MSLEILIVAVPFLGGARPVPTSPLPPVAIWETPHVREKLSCCLMNGTAGFGLDDRENILTANCIVFSTLSARGRVGRTERIYG